MWTIIVTVHGTYNIKTVNVYFFARALRSTIFARYLLAAAGRRKERNVLCFLFTVCPNRLMTHTKLKAHEVNTVKLSM